MLWETKRQTRYEEIWNSGDKGSSCSVKWSGQSRPHQEAEN